MARALRAFIVSGSFCQKDDEQDENDNGENADDEAQLTTGLQPIQITRDLVQLLRSQFGHGLLDFFDGETEIGESLRHDFGLQYMLDCLNIGGGVPYTHQFSGGLLRGDYCTHQVPWRTTQQQ